MVEDTDSKLFWRTSVPLKNLSPANLTSVFAENNGLSETGLQSCLQQLNTVLQDDRSMVTSLPIFPDPGKNLLQITSLKAEIDEFPENENKVFIKLEPLSWNVEQNQPGKASFGSDAGPSCSHSASAGNLPPYFPVRGTKEESLARLESNAGPSWSCSASAGNQLPHSQVRETEEGSLVTTSDCPIENGYVSSNAFCIRSGGVLIECNSNNTVPLLEASRTADTQLSPSSLPKFVCPHCSFKTVNLSVMQGHLNGHKAEGKNVFVCIQCKYKTNNEDYYLNHLASACLHSIGDQKFGSDYFKTNNVDKPLSSDLCSYRTESMDAVQIDLEHVYVKSEPIHGADSKATLRNEYVQQEASVIKLFYCDLCSYKTNNKQVLQKHLLVHDGNRIKPFACNQCSYKADCKHKLHCHILTHDCNRIKPFACDQCLYRTDQQRCLNRHLLTHESNRIKPFACNQCSYRAYQQSTLNRHFLTHESNRITPFACDQCPYSSDRKRNLQRHLLTHKSYKIKPFACDQCPYSTDGKGHLQRHRLTHDSNRIKQFACLQCSYRADQQSTLNRHLLTHEVIKSMH